MKTLVLKYGLISGAIVIAMMAITLPLCLNGTIDFENSGEVFGYSGMVLGFLFVFFGIRRYREDVGGGAISFGRAFKVGILITLVASAAYVVCWEIVYWGFFPNFLDLYNAHALEKLRSGGASAAEIQAAQSQMAMFVKLYANPLFNAGITFLEIFPVGLVVTLVSAAILRRKTPAAPSMATA